MKTMVAALIGAVLLSVVPARQLMAQSNASPFRPQENATPTAAASAEKASANNSAAPDPELKIASGDLLEFSVFGADFSCGAEKNDCDARVNSAGNVVLPLIGSVSVAGLTVVQAEQLVATRLSQGEFYNDPQVTITQKEYATQGISVGGEVGKPGIYPLLGAHTLLQAISAAGGTTVKAGNDVSIIHKENPNQPQHADLSLIAGGNTPLVPGDTVWVSKAGIVYVVGDVKQPSGIVMERSGLTVMKAIAMAQGTNSTAALNDAKVIRNTPQGKQEIPISVKKIMFDKSPDVELQPEDVLFIPNSLAKSATKRSL
jgi:polysaccharide biosynthesis/export protein